MRNFLTSCVAILCCFLSVNLIGQNCNCLEYLYVNEIGNGGQVHKYEINSDGSLTEINPGGPWYPNGGVSELPAPHGLGYDYNGDLYIGSTYQDDGEIRKLDCDGNIYPTSEFVISPIGITAATSLGSTLYLKGGGSNTGLFSYDLCTGAAIDTFCLVNSSGNYAGISWDFYIDRNTEDFYVSSVWDDGLIYRFTEADTVNCLTPTITGALNNTGLSSDRMYGITTDPNGNIYMVLADGYPGAAMIRKFDSAGNIIADTPIDALEDGTGWYGAIGLEYSATCDCLYTSNGTTTDDCVSIFDTDLNYIGAGVGPIGGVGGGNAYSSFNKAIGIRTECCPGFTNEVIDTTICGVTVGSKILLNEFLPCEDICAGAWAENGNNTAVGVYNDCANEFTLTGSGEACFDYSYTPSGTDPNELCTAFSVDLCVTFNIGAGCADITVTRN